MRLQCCGSRRDSLSVRLRLLLLLRLVGQCRLLRFGLMYLHLLVRQCLRLCLRLRVRLHQRLRLRLDLRKRGSLLSRYCLRLRNCQSLRLELRLRLRKRLGLLQCAQVRDNAGCMGMVIAVGSVISR